MLMESSLASSIEAARFFVSDCGKEDILCGWMPGTETWQMCSNCDKRSHGQCRKAESVIEGKENADGPISLNFPRSYAQPSTVSTMSESYAPNFVYRRRKLRGNSINMFSPQAAANTKRSADCLSVISSDAPSMAAKEQHVGSQVEHESRTVGSPFMAPLLCNKESHVLKSESINGCSVGEGHVSDAALKNTMQKILEVDSVNDSCSSSKSNLELVSASMTTEMDDTGECSSSSVMVTEVKGGQLSENDRCISILRSQGLVRRVLPTKSCDSAEDAGTSSGGSCSRSCKICGHSESTLNMLICDLCEEAFHVSCFNPRMKEKIGSSRVELNENNIENATEETRNVKEKIEDPKVGMMFNSIDDIMKYYTRYGKEKGFAVAKRSSKKGDDGEVRYVTIACNRAGKPRNRSSNPLKLQSESKTDCKAQLRAVLCPDGKWILNAMVLDHNHGLSPSRTRYYKCNRLLEPHAKKRFASNDKADIRMKKNLKSFVVEAGGHENLSFVEKDCRNKLSCLHLGEGDVAAMQDFFLKMQVDNSDFFYTMDFNENGRLRNVFWADARSRATFKEFGDVVMFDTTYLVNKYDIPFAHFVGVNHHGQSTLLGCGLISNEDTETFTWLFQTWLRCMFGCPPCAIVTDHDKAMKKAIEIVFPKARHRWCLSHIMEKLSKKLRGYQEYESIKICMQNAVYDSLTKEEFEESWGKFVEKYKLESNEWLLGLYDERCRWVPAFVKDIFWAGMSTTKQGESMNAFFDGYISLKTTLKQFLDQYEPAIAKKSGK